MRILLPGALSALFLAGALASLAPAQQPPQGPQVAPNATQPTTTTQGTSNVVAVPAYQPPPIINVNGYNPAYGYYPSSPYGSYLSGRADLINARANAAVTQQQANLVQQDVYRSQIDSRRAIQDEARYERETTMNSEQVRLKDQIDGLRRARNEPPLNEIWSGQSLNALFTDIKKAHIYGVRGPAVPINQDLLKHINLTTGVTSAGAGALKNGSKLQWPVALKDSAFEENRRQLERMTEDALQQAKSGMVSQTLVSDMRATIETMQVVLKQMVKEVPPGPYIEGKKYLRELDTSFAALKDPNASNYFNGKYSAQGATVYDLTSYMANNGLTFAPAVSGDQPSYTVLYQALLTYDVQMSQSVSH
jgi:hypothetical protein